MVRLRKTHATVLTALATAGCGTVVPEAELPEMRSQAALEQALPEAVDLATWDQSQLYAGWRAESLLDMAVHGAGGEEIGEVEDIVIGPDGRIQAIVVESGGVFGIGATHLRVPWEEVRFGSGLESVTVPVRADNVERYGMEDQAAAATGPRAFRATDLLGDYVNLEDYRGYAVVDDLIFSPDGELQAVTVLPDVAYGTATNQPVGAPYAFPYYGFGFGFDPGAGFFDLPYATADIAGYPTFNYDLVRPGL